VVDFATKNDCLVTENKSLATENQYFAEENKSLTTENEFLKEQLGLLRAKRFGSVREA